MRSAWILYPRVDPSATVPGERATLGSRLYRVRARFIVWIAAVTVVAACGGKGVPAGEGRGERGAEPDDALVVAAPASPSARADDPDHRFLRTMLAHHAALTAISHTAARNAADPAARKQAGLVDVRHDTEKDRLRALLRTEFADSTEAVVLPEHQAVADSLARHTAGAYSRAFRDRVILLDREAVAQVDTFLPHAKRPRVRQLAQDIRATRLREIADLQRSAEVP